MKWFKSNKTKWIPLGSYNTVGEGDYIVFVRGNTKTGMMEFKCKHIHRYAMYKYSILPKEIINVKKQWEEIQQMINP